MKTSLEQLDKAIQGTVVMSMELESMATKFLDDRVPAMWEGVGYPSLKPLSSWVPDLIQRLEFISKWLYEGPPDSFWVPAFFFPQGFMTATLQGYARKTQTPIDALQFSTNVRDFFGDDIKIVPETGTNIHGLFLQGAKWDFNKQCLEDSDPKKAIIPFPAIWLEPCDIGENLEVAATAARSTRPAPGAVS